MAQEAKGKFDPRLFHAQAIVGQYADQMLTLAEFGRISEQEASRKAEAFTRRVAAKWGYSASQLG